MTTPDPLATTTRVNSWRSWTTRSVLAIVDACRSLGQRKPAFVSATSSPRFDVPEAGACLLLSTSSAVRCLTVHGGCSTWIPHPIGSSPRSRPRRERLACLRERRFLRKHSALAASRARCGVCQNQPTRSSRCRLSHRFEAVSTSLVRRADLCQCRRGRDAQCGLAEALANRGFAPHLGSSATSSPRRARGRLLCTAVPVDQSPRPRCVYQQQDERTRLRRLASAFLVREILSPHLRARRSGDPGR